MLDFNPSHFIGGHRLRWEACAGLFYPFGRGTSDSIRRAGADELARGADAEGCFHSKSLRLVEAEWVIAFGEKHIEWLKELLMDMVFLVQCNLDDDLELLFLPELNCG